MPHPSGEAGPPSPTAPGPLAPGQSYHTGSTVPQAGGCCAPHRSKCPTPGIPMPSPPPPAATCVPQGPVSCSLPPQMVSHRGQGLGPTWLLLHMGRAAGSCRTRWLLLCSAAPKPSSQVPLSSLTPSATLPSESALASFCQGRPSCRHAELRPHLQRCLRKCCLFPSPSPVVLRWPRPTHNR